MSATITTQTHLYAFSGSTAWTDGSGMHTWITRDWPLQLNNLGAYVDLRSQLVMCPRVTSFPSGEFPYGAVERLSHTSSREIYMSQVPLVVPWHAKRMVWTAGIEARSLGGLAITISACRVYLSGTPYNGPSAEGSTAYAFDTAGLAADYLASSAITMTHNTTTTEYQLADDSTTGITPCVAASMALDGEDRKAFLVLTVTASGGAQRYVRVYDFTYWFLYS